MIRTIDERPACKVDEKIYTLWVTNDGKYLPGFWSLAVEGRPPYKQVYTNFEQTNSRPVSEHDFVTGWFDLNADEVDHAYHVGVSDGESTPMSPAERYAIKLEIIEELAQKADEGVEAFPNGNIGSTISRWLRYRAMLAITEVNHDE